MALRVSLGDMQTSSFFYSADAFFFRCKIGAKMWRQTLWIERTLMDFTKLITYCQIWLRKSGNNCPLHVALNATASMRSTQKRREWITKSLICRRQQKRLDATMSFHRFCVCVCVVIPCEPLETTPPTKMWWDIQSEYVSSEPSIYYTHIPSPSPSPS